MIKRVLLSLLIPSLAFGAITERYVSTAGSGSADGTSAANAMSYATFKDYMETGGSFTAAAGDRFDLVSTFSIGASDTWLNGGTATSPVVVRGYASAITDGNLGRTNGNGALITTNFASLTYASTFRLTVSGSFITLENLNISGTVANPLITLAASDNVKTCNVSNASTNASAGGLTLGDNDIIRDSDIQLTGASGGNAAISNGTAATTRIVACRIKGNTAPGLLVSSGSPIVVGNVFFTDTNAIAVSSTGKLNVIGNTFVGSTGDAIDTAGISTTTHLICDNMFTDNTGYAMDFNSAAVSTFTVGNRYRDNVAGTINLATDWTSTTNFGAITTDTGGSETDYNNFGSNDFTPVYASPAHGTGQFLYRDIGAIQRQEPVPTTSSKIPSL